MRSKLCLLLWTMSAVMICMRTLWSQASATMEEDDALYALLITVRLLRGLKNMGWEPSKTEFDDTSSFSATFGGTCFTLSVKLVDEDDMWRPLLPEEMIPTGETAVALMAKQFEKPLSDGTIPSLVTMTRKEVESRFEKVMAMREGLPKFVKNGVTYDINLPDKKISSELPENMVILTQVPVPKQNALIQKLGEVKKLVSRNTRKVKLLASEEEQKAELHTKENEQLKFAKFPSEFKGESEPPNGCLAKWGPVETKA